VVVHKLLVDLELDAWQRQLDVQLTGPFLTIKHVGRHMIARAEQGQDGGKIVNISSVSALMGRVKGGPHCAAKGGLTMLTKVAAIQSCSREPVRSMGASPPGRRLKHVRGSDCYPE
jgi:NAD(P)-dependent dehydrogenase (short-subunit alcohol dehydrogenase family)